MGVDAIEVDVRGANNIVYLNHDPLVNNSLSRYLKFNDLFSYIPAGIGIMIDVKERINEHVIVKNLTCFKGNIYLSGHEIQTIKKLKEQLPKAIALASVETLDDLKNLPSFIDGVSLKYTLATHDIISKLKDSGYYVAIWTVNSPKELFSIWWLGVDAVITDNPSVIKKSVKNFTVTSNFNNQIKISQFKRQR